VDVGLIDVDGHHFPNLPLMKISTYHKTRGDSVKFYEPLTDKLNVVYMSKVFDYTPDYQYPIMSDELIKGGTGYGQCNELPTAVESAYPDYKLYGISNTAYGFLTRGCPRACPFCVVSEKEGIHSHKVADVSHFWRGQREIKLLDPNLLACTDKYGLLEQLVESRAYVDFTQGLDIRFLDDNATNLILRMKIKTIRFAWDLERDSNLILSNLRKFKLVSKYDYRKLRVYVLTNFNTDFKFDLERVYTLRDMGYDPYIMIFNKEHAARKYWRLQRWVNNKFIFRSDPNGKFDNYKEHRTNV